MVAAINGALAPRLDGIQGLMGMLAADDKPETEVTQLGVQVAHHDQRMNDVERQLRGRDWYGVLVKPHVSAHRESSLSQREQGTTPAETTSHTS